MRDLIGWTLVASAVAYVLAVAYVALFRGPGVRRRPRSTRPNVAQASGRPAPSVWRRPDPHAERWRRWARRAHDAIWHGKGSVPALLPNEPVWQRATTPRATWAPPNPIERAARRLAPFEDTGALVRPYVRDLYATRERNNA